MRLRQYYPDQEVINEQSDPNLAETPHYKEKQTILPNPISNMDNVHKVHTPVKRTADGKIKKSEKKDFDNKPSIISTPALPAVVSAVVVETNSNHTPAKSVEMTASAAAAKLGEDAKIDMRKLIVEHKHHKSSSSSSSSKYHSSASSHHSSSSKEKHRSTSDHHRNHSSSSKSSSSKHRSSESRKSSSNHSSSSSSMANVASQSASTPILSSAHHHSSHSTIPLTATKIEEVPPAPIQEVTVIATDDTQSEPLKASMFVTSASIPQNVDAVAPVTATAASTQSDHKPSFDEHSRKGAQQISTATTTPMKLHESGSSTMKSSSLTPTTSLPLLQTPKIKKPITNHHIKTPNSASKKTSSDLLSSIMASMDSTPTRNPSSSSF